MSRLSRDVIVKTSQNICVSPESVSQSLRRQMSPNEKKKKKRTVEVKK